MTHPAPAAEQNDGKVFVSCEGSIDFAVLDTPETRAANIAIGPIRLQVGYPGEKGFGYLHIQQRADRIKQIQGAGYPGAPEFCLAVARKFTSVGSVRDGRLVLVWETAHYEHQLILQWVGEGGFWTIVTGVPSRVARRFTLICKVARTSGSEPTPLVAKRPRFATLSLPKKFDAGSNGS